MEKKLYYNLECPSTDGGGPITLCKRTLLEMIEAEIQQWEGDQDLIAEPLEFKITPVEMTEDEFDQLPEYQF